MTRTSKSSIGRDVKSNGVADALDVRVPEHWQVVPLENILDDIIGGGTPSRSNLAYWGGEIPWLTVKDMRSQRPEDSIDHISEEAVTDSATNIIPADTVIIATRIGLGKVIRVSYPAAINQDLKALIAKPGIDKGYLEYWIVSIAEYLQSIGSGTTVKGIRLEQLRSLPFPLAPEGEQKRIVAEIEKQFSRLDEAVALLKRVKANLKRYKAAVLKAAVEGKLTEDWRKAHPNVEPASKLLERILAERRALWEKNELARMKVQRVSRRNANWRMQYKEAQPPKPNETFEIPQTWVWTTLGQLSWSVKDGPHYSPKYSERGVPFISGGNIRPEGIDFSTAKYISPELHQELTERCKPEYGDLLYTKGGTTGIARINTERREFSVWVHVAVLKLVDSVKRFYLQHVLNSPHCYRQSQEYTHGVGNQDLGLTRMIWITIPLPPLHEQEQIVAEVERRLSVIDKLEAAIESNLVRADRFRQSILQQAFSGSLKVTEYAATGEVSSPRIAAQTNAPYTVTEEILMSKRPATSSRHSRTLLEALEELDSPVSPEELFSLCGFDSTAIDQVERFYAELNELIDTNKVEELRPAYDRVTLKAIQ